MLLFCISSLGLVCSVLAQEKTVTPVRPDVDYSSLIAQVKERLLEYKAQSNVPGLAIALVDGDKLVWAEGFGTTNRLNQTKVTADTLFNLQSVSKNYTATGFLIAVEKGLMKLDDPLKKYYPEFTVNSRLGADEANRITFRHLLSHWSGLAHLDPCVEYRPCRFTDYIRSISDTWLMFPVGERHSYSNLGIALAGYALELRSGKPFDEFMDEELFRPLGMTSSTFNYKVAANHPSVANGHSGNSITPAPSIPTTPARGRDTSNPAGGMYSSVKDMARYISFHLAGCKIGGKQIIGETLLKEMYTPQFSVEGQAVGYGLGIESSPLHSGTLLQHSGYGYGYLTSQMWSPEYQVGVVILTNSESGNPSSIAKGVLQEMITVKYGPLPQWKPGKLADKPIITLDTRLLQRLAGTYKFTGYVEAFKGYSATFKVKEDSLYIVTATNEVKLNAHSPTEFTRRYLKFTFILDEKGKPRGLQVVASAGVEFVAFNDSPDEEAGPNKREWQDFVGEYSRESNNFTVTIKNGYLYLEDRGGLKLNEYKPGLFFTPEGKAIILQRNGMFWDNRLYRKKSTETSLDIPQISTIQPGDKYADKLRIFEEFVRKQMEKDKIPGLTIGFYKDGYGWVKGFGYADIENKLPAHAESAYRLASITKTFTGVAILQLVEQGKLSLDGEIQTYLPSYPKQRWPVTVKQLLTHTGGGPGGSGLGPTYVSPKEVVERIARYPIQTEPGTKYQYTTSGYNLLGAAIEEVTKMSLDDYFKKSIFEPLGLKDTRMDSVRDIIPNRVRGYEVVNGQIKNILHIDVSSRFGGGGLTGTVPDLLRWARGVDDGRLLSKESLALMYSPVATRDGRYVGLNDGHWYYTLGWLQFPLNGQLAIWNDGGQFGTNTALIRIPAKNMAIAFACNIQDIDRMVYLKRLYELITDEPSEIRIFARNDNDRPIVDALDSSFKYGSLYFERTKKAFTTEEQELAGAFAYFNRVTNREVLAADYQATMKAIEDGRHRVAGDPFIKVGSYIAMKLREKYGAEHSRKFSLVGPIPFFADYFELYKADQKIPRQLRFNEAFEKLIAKWNEDWRKAWNDETRNLNITDQSDFDAIGGKLKPLFANAEVYPNLIDPLLSIDRAAANAAKLAVELYPQSARANGRWGLSLLALNQYGEALSYFKRSLELRPDGFAGNRNAWNEIVLKLLNAGKVDDTLSLLSVAIENHPRAAHFHAGLCYVYSQKGMKEKATEACKRALEIDPNLAPYLQEWMK
jgi:CubicO group peptidase (beta-lactamase class C family)